MKKFVVIILAVAFGYVLSIGVSLVRATEAEKAIASYKHECLKYNDSAEECSEMAISIVNEELETKKNNN